MYLDKEEYYQYLRNSPTFYTLRDSKQHLRTWFANTHMVNFQLRVYTSAPKGLSFYHPEALAPQQIVFKNRPQHMANYRVGRSTLRAGTKSGTVYS